MPLARNIKAGQSYTVGKSISYLNGNVLEVYCKYTLNEAEIAGAISSVIAGSGMTPNRYITTAIREKPVRDGYLTA